MQASPRPPFVFISLYDDTSETYDTVERLALALEFYDSDEPIGVKEGVVLDSDRRVVRLRIEAMEIKQYGLHEAGPVSDDDVMRMRHEYASYLKSHPAGCLIIFLLALVGVVW